MYLLYLIYFTILYINRGGKRSLCHRSFKRENIRSTKKSDAPTKKWLDMTNSWRQGTHLSYDFSLQANQPYYSWDNNLINYINLHLDMGERCLKVGANWYNTSKFGNCLFSYSRKSGVLPIFYQMKCVVYTIEYITSAFSPQSSSSLVIMQDLGAKGGAKPTLDFWRPMYTGLFLDGFSKPPNHKPV